MSVLKIPLGWRLLQVGEERTTGDKHYDARSHTWYWVSVEQTIAYRHVLAWMRPIITRIAPPPRGQSSRLLRNAVRQMNASCRVRMTSP